ncbi:MAG: GNAT family N-acetyltransferase [Sporolactobacillus sp.]
MDFTIRKMQNKDIQQVQQIAKISWNATYKGIIPFNIQESFLNYAYNNKMMKKRIEQSFLFVSEVNRNIVGFANFSPVKKDGEVELEAIYLCPQFQGKGIGTALLKEGIRDLKGVKKVFVNVEKENKIGTNFYTSKGFDVISEFDDNFDGHILKTVRMALKV